MISRQFPLKLLDPPAELPHRVLKEDESRPGPESNGLPRVAHKTYLEHFTEPLKVQELHLQVLLHLPGKREISRLPLPAFQVAAFSLVQHDLPRRIAGGRGRLPGCLDVRLLLRSRSWLGSLSRLGGRRLLGG